MDNYLSLYPDELPAVPGGDATFTCSLVSTTSSTRILNIRWLVNDSLLEPGHLRGVVPKFSTIGRGIGTLLFTNLSIAYHMTRIQCRAELSPEATSTSNNATLLIHEG